MKRPIFSSTSSIPASPRSIPRPRPMTSTGFYRKFRRCSKTKISAKPFTNACSTSAVSSSSTSKISTVIPSTPSPNSPARTAMTNSAQTSRCSSTACRSPSPTEVKKPNNGDGILAERHRTNTRLQNPKFRRFVNLTQPMVFPNNMEYDSTSPEPLQGAYYVALSRGEPVFNYFRKEPG